MAGLIETIHQFIQQYHQPDEKGEERIQKLVWFAVPFTDRLSDFLESVVLQKETDYDVELTG